MSLSSEIVRIMQGCADEIRANLAAEKINASGRTSESIRVREVAGGFQLVVGRDGEHAIETKTGKIMQRDTAPAETLEIGRPAGRVPMGFYYIIKQWTREKGLTFGSERERATFAYFVAQKIAREGTKRNAANVNVYSDAVRGAVGEIEQACKAEVTGLIRAAIDGQRINTNINF